jgi:hypothetical protein
LYLTSQVVTIKDPDLALMSDGIALCRTAKAYQTQNSMAVYVEQVLVPYRDQVRANAGDQTLPIYLVMDNCPSHSTDVLSALYARESIIPIWLPAHSSHFLQPLDLGPFGDVKGRYRRSVRKKTKPQWQGKVLRIDQAWHGSKYALNVFHSWRAAGIRPRNSAIPRWHVEWSHVEEKITEFCPREEATVQNQESTT